MSKNKGWKWELKGALCGAVILFGVSVVEVSLIFYNIYLIPFGFLLIGTGSYLVIQHDKASEEKNAHLIDR